jgi:hypothetical protein
LIAAVAGLGFAIDQIAHPPPVVSPLPENIPVRPPAANLPHLLGSTAGVGETVAVVALVCMIIGLTAALSLRLSVV